MKDSMSQSAIDFRVRSTPTVGKWSLTSKLPCGIVRHFTGCVAKVFQSEFCFGQSGETIFEFALAEKRTMMQCEGLFTFSTE